MTGDEPGSRDDPASSDDPTSTPGDEPAFSDDPAATAEWPVALSGVTETVVTTLGPNGLWNAAALGLFARDTDGDGTDRADTKELVTVRTWGNTRTRRNFHRRGEGYVQFVDDPVAFAEAALSIVERDDPVLESANAWVRVTAEPIDSGTDEGTDWEAWALRPVDAEIVRETVPTIDRGFGAVVEATVAASRLEVSGFDDGALRERLEYYASIVDRAGGPREREALERIREHSAW